MNTAHAKIRSQQRGIPPIVVDMLLQFGHREHDHAGAEIVYFDRHSKKKTESYTGGLIGKLSEYLDSYTVVADRNFITLDTRYKRINHY